MRSAERSCELLEYILDLLEDYGVWGLAVHSFIDAIFFPVPAFFLQVSLSMVNPKSALWLATAGYAACILGTPFGYLIGKTVGSAIMYKILKRSWVDKATAMFQEKGETAILIGSFTPIPFKVFTILSGSFHYPLWKLLAYAAMGRAVKFYVVGILFYVYGRAAEGMVEGVSYYVAAVAIALILGYLLVKKRLAVRKNRAKQQQRVEQDV